MILVAPEANALETTEDYQSVRNAIMTDLITDASLEDSVIAGPLFHPMAEIDIRSKIPRFKAVGITGAHTLEQIVSMLGYNDEQKLKLRAAVITRTAYRLIRRVRQLARLQAGEESEQYEKTDWDKLREELLAESDGYVDELNGGEAGELSPPMSFRVLKAS